MNYLSRDLFIHFHPDSAPQFLGFKPHIYIGVRGLGGSYDSVITDNNIFYQFCSESGTRTHTVITDQEIFLPHLLLHKQTNIDFRFQSTPTYFRAPIINCEATLTGIKKFSFIYSLDG